MAGPLAFGLAGVAILLALGLWQMQRLAWKQGVRALIGARMEAPAGPLPDAPQEDIHEYAPVRVAGRIGEGELHVLTSAPGRGPGYRVIAPLTLDDGRQVLLDRGFVPEAEKARPRPRGPVAVEGNLHWPDETDRFTPEPNLERNIWFARAVGPMAAALGTEPVLVVARQLSLDGTTPVPVTVAIRNDHLEYAITWFALAAVWTVMTGYLLWRIKRRID